MTDVSPDCPKSKLYSVLAQVPQGQVVSYGQLAALCGMPRAARWVGRSLSQLPEDTQLPWHRVVGANGLLSLPADSPSGAEQRRRLQQEGITVTATRINIKRHCWHP